MRQSQLFTRVERSAPKDETAINAQLLERGGFIYKNSAGIYSFLPLGWRVLQKIARIIREEMNTTGAQEMFMAALHDKHYLKATGRWDVDVVFKVVEGGKSDPSFNVSWTHEEVMTEIATKYVSSYKDLPFAAYQIQTKFRNEPRAKSGLLRGREFMMKDLYSFHASEEDLHRYYHQVAAPAYKKVFERCGLKAIFTLAAGGDFTLSNTHEFQVLSDVGEDTIYVCEKCEYAENKEISKLKNGECPQCNGKMFEKQSIEVGNIFPLGTKYSEAFNLKFKDEKGESKSVVMGSYGIGLGRVMATAVEVHHDEHGIIWPESIAPFRAHLIALGGTNADALYGALQKANIEVLYDDREKSPGEKFAEADVLGIPWRLVTSPKLGEGNIEVKKRSEKKTEILTLQDVLRLLT